MPVNVCRSHKYNFRNFNKFTYNKIAEREVFSVSKNCKGKMLYQLNWCCTCFKCCPIIRCRTKCSICTTSWRSCFYWAECNGAFFLFNQWLKTFSGGLSHEVMLWMVAWPLRTCFHKCMAASTTEVRSTETNRFFIIFWLVFLFYNQLVYLSTCLLVYLSTRLLIPLISDMSAGSQLRELSCSFVSHLAASCSFSVSCPERMWHE